jgi:hypothetical protein
MRGSYDTTKAIYVTSCINRLVSTAVGLDNIAVTGAIADLTTDALLRALFSPKIAW